jgi:hypothetical protein
MNRFYRHFSPKIFDSMDFPFLYIRMSSISSDTTLAMITGGIPFVLCLVFRRYITTMPGVGSDVIPISIQIWQRYLSNSASLVPQQFPDDSSKYAVSFDYCPPSFRSIQIENLLFGSSFPQLRCLFLRVQLKELQPSQLKSISLSLRLKQLVL